MGIYHVSDLSTFGVLICYKNPIPAGGQVCLGWIKYVNGGYVQGGLYVVLCRCLA